MNISTIRPVAARLGLAGALLLVASRADANLSFVVDTLADRTDDNTGDGVCHTSANTCSLRAAIMEANSMAGPGVARIRVPAGTYTLTRAPSGANGADSGDLNLSQPNSVSQFLAITGAGSATTIIDANQLDRVFDIAVGRDVSIAGVTLRNGRASDRGGGIFNRGMLSLAACRVESNHAGQGGGGGIYNQNELVVASSTVAANDTPGDGAGIFSTNSLLVLASTLRSNRTLGIGNGGGLYLDGPATVERSTIHGNTANSGGGILTTSQLSVVNSTISGNAANLNGGGIYNFGITNMLNSSVVDNDADHDRDEEGGIGGGVYAAAGSGRRFLVTNSLIARNTVLDAPIYNDCSGTLEAFGRNFFHDLAGCNIPNPGSGLVALNTIGLLQSNGGPTWTHALLVGSQAIDATADNLGCIDIGGDPLTLDQRGAQRPAGVRCDVGAFEYGAIVDVIFQNGLD